MQGRTAGKCSLGCDGTTNRFVGHGSITAASASPPLSVVVNEVEIDGTTLSCSLVRLVFIDCCLLPDSAVLFPPVVVEL